MATPTTEDTSVRLCEPRSRSELVLEMIALRHQIAVLKRSGTRHPCFGLCDRLFWILLSWRWPRWPERSNDEWQHVNDTASISTPLGFEYVDIDIGASATAPIRFTFNWRETRSWEGRDYAVAIAK